VHERVVHRDRAVAVARGGGRREVGERRAERDADVLDEMVPQVTARPNREIEAGVARERHEHVVEERLPRVDVRAAGAAREVDADLRLARLADDRRHSLNSSTTARGSIAPVYRAIPTTAPDTPPSASARRSFTF